MIMKVCGINTKPETIDFETKTLIIKYAGKEYVINEKDDCLMISKSDDTIIQEEKINVETIKGFNHIYIW